MSRQIQLQSPPEVTAEEVRAEMESLLRSPQFQRSEKLQAFLRFVCETALDGRAAEINEYLIGSKVFRRGDQYNPSEDSVVRRHAHAMRQKLQEYYATEGAANAIRIEMPVGRYVPLFRRREEALTEVLPAPVLTAAAHGADWSQVAIRLVAALAIFVAGYAAASLYPHSGTKISSDVREIWEPWMGSEAVVCFSNPTSAVVRYYPGRVTDDAAAHSFRVPAGQEQLFRDKFALPPGGAIHLFPTIAQTMMGEASAATHVTTLFAQTGIPMRTMESRFLSWEALRRANYVILSGDVENHWVDAILAKYPLRVSNSADGGPRAIVNTAPQGSELSIFRVIGTEETREEYALISMLPGIARDRELLLICGLNSPAAPSATEFLTTENGLSQLREGLRRAAPNHSGPWRFQAVIKADVRDKVPTTASIVTIRVL